MTILAGVEAREAIKQKKADRSGYDYSIQRGLINLNKDQCVYMKWSNGDSLYAEGTIEEFEKMLAEKPSLKLVKWKEIKEMCEFVREW